MNRIRTKTTLVIGAALLMSAAGAPLMAADELPKGETILDKYVEVTGGKAAYQKMHSSIATGSMEMAAMGLKGKLTVYHAEPNLIYTEIELEGIGKVAQGSDGKVAWMNSAIQGPHVMEGAERAQALRAARFNGELNWRDNYKKAETQAVESVDGKDCYKVVLTPADGYPETHFYDKESGLLLKTSMTLQTPIGEIRLNEFPTDYRTKWDILPTHKGKHNSAGQEITLSIDSVEFNREIPKDRFDPPDDIKALVQK